MTKQIIKINFSDFWFPLTKENLQQWDLYIFLSKKYDLEIVENPDFLIYGPFGKEFLKNKQSIRIFITGENVRPNFKDCHYAFSFDFPVTKQNYRLPLYKLYLSDYETAKVKHDDLESVNIKNRKFCNFVYSNANAIQRIEFLNLLGKYKKIDSGGSVLNNIGYNVDDKIHFLSQYKFTIAFENSNYPGYTTEKILQAFSAKTIPVYWGNPLVEMDFNPKAFINCHNYETFDDVIKRIIEIDEDDDLYMSYLREPIFINNQENEFVKEENIFNRFDEIFNQKYKDLTYKKNGILKYYLLNLRSLIKTFLNRLQSKKKLKQ